MSSISAGTTALTSLVATGDTSGELVLKTGPSNTAGLSIDASQNVAVTGGLTFNNGTSVASTGKAIAMAIVFGG